MDFSQDKIEGGPVNSPTHANNNCEESPTNVGTKPISPTPITLSAESQQILKDTPEAPMGSTIAQEVGEDTRSRFWATYRREAKEYDEPFLERYKDDMDIVLIFAGLFSAVSTSFITSMRSSLSQDPTAITNALLMQIVHANNASAFAGQNLELPVWHGPGSTIIWTQSLIFASLAASLLAALGAVLGKQWLANYRQPISGTSEERGLSRQRKLDALNDWYFQAMLEVLPVLLQMSLLLFGTALSAYVWTQQTTVGAIVVGATVVGVFFYASITVASLVSPDCPFQTPLATTVRTIQYPLTRWSPHLYKRIPAVNMRRYNILQRFPVIKQIINHCIHAIPKSPNLVMRRITRRNAPNRNDLEIQPILIPSEPAALCLHLPSRPLHEHEAPAVRWLLEASTDQEVLLIAAQLVPDIEWPAKVDVSEACVQLQNAFTGCFMSAPGNLALTPFSETRAYFFGKALLHLSCIRKPFANTKNGHWDSLVDYYTCLGTQKDVNSSCLSAVADGLASRIKLNTQDSFTSLDCQWLLHIFPYMLASLAPGVRLADQVLFEVIKWLNSPSSSQQILADCFLSAALILGAPIDRKDWVKIDKSSAADKLLRVLLRQYPSVHDITAGLFARSLQGDWAAALLSPLAAFLERGGIYPNFGTCGSGECSCNIVDWTVGITKSFALRTRQWADQQAQDWKYAREALHIGAVLSATTPGDPPTQDRWNPTYRGHPTPFSVDIDESDWVIDFLDHHYDICDEGAIADMFYMLSQSRDIEQWAKSYRFIEALVHGMHHDKMHVRHPALQVAFRMRSALAGSATNIGILLPGLYAAVSTSNESSTQFTPHEDRDFCFLRILYTFTLHHDHIWTTDIKISEQCYNIAAKSWLDAKPIAALYLIAIMDILEDRDMRCNFRNSINQNLSFAILSKAWRAVDHAVYENRARNVEDLTLQVKSGSEMLDELLPRLIAFTTRYQKTHMSAMVGWVYRCIPGLVLQYLQQTVPESPAIGLMQGMISRMTVFATPP